MTGFVCSVNGFPCQSLDVYVGQQGPWYADVVMSNSEDISGVVTIAVGSLRLVGTVVAGGGSFVLQRSFRVVAGAGSWGTYLRPRHYHSEYGLDMRLIAADAARECGESLGVTDFGGGDFGPDFVRRSGPASLAIERLAAVAVRQWWVDYDGKTRVGLRPSLTPVKGSYQIGKYSPLHRIAEISLDDPAAIGVGSVLTERVSTPQIVREFEIHVEKNALRVRAYTGGDDMSTSRLGRALTAIIDKRDAQRFHGTYRYRVFADPHDGTLTLQVVSPLAGLPDILPVRQAAGIAGGLSKLTPGAIVRVAFDEGDVNSPYVSSYAHGDPGSTAGIARIGDLTLAGGAGTTITFSLGPALDLVGLSPAALGLPGSTGAPLPVVACGVPYYVHFDNMLSPDPIAAAAFVAAPSVTGVGIDGTIVSGSDQEIE